MSGTLEEIREQARQRKAGSALKSKTPALSNVSTPKLAYKPGPLFDGSAIKAKIKHEKIDEAFIIIPDVHSYVRDVGAYEVTMEAIKVIADSYNVTKFVQLGDLMECGEMSTHSASHVDEQIPNYIEEVDWAVNDFWARSMASCKKGTEFHALLGNHEHRVNKKLLDRLGRGDTTRELYNHLMPTEIYKNIGINVTPYGNENEGDGMLKLLPGLVCVHGWSFSEHCASVHVKKMQNSCSVIHGHTHRLQEFYQKLPGQNTLVAGYSMGALCKTNLFFQSSGPPTNHALAFGVVFVHGENTFTVHSLPILGNNHREVMLPSGAVIST